VSIRTAYFAVALSLAASCLGFGAQQAAKPSPFNQAVISKAISFMPDDLKTKLSAVEKEILAAAKPPTSGPTQHLSYFVEKEMGSGPSTLAEQFRIVRKKVGEHASYSVLAPYLGKLAGTIIALSEPYHTEESALKGEAHAAFEKALDESASKLKAEFDGNNKVDNPSEFAVQSAKRANEILAQLGSAENPDPSANRSAVFSLATNGIADCWWTLLPAEKTKTADETAPPAEGDFIGNKRSLKFHLTTCKYLPAEKNRVHFKTRDEAVNEGYVPCKVCKP